jgi:hypothetical protein
MSDEETKPAGRIKVALLHNVARDDAGHHLSSWIGYQPGDPLVRVFEFDVPAVEFGDHDPSMADRIAGFAFDVANGYRFNNDPQGQRLAEQYQARGLRNLVKGDVIVIGHVPLACRSYDWAPLLGELNEVTDQHTGEYGTRPLRPY